MAWLWWVLEEIVEVVVIELGDRCAMKKFR